MHRTNRRRPRDLPTAKQLLAELQREQARRCFLKQVRGAAGILLCTMAAAALAATLWLPVLQICGGSMAPTLRDGEILLSVKTSDIERGDILAFWHNNELLVKRVIATVGDWIDIDEDGTVRVNGAPLEEPYLAERALGDCEVDLPLQVPEGRCFVMGDHRSTSVDSRSAAVGCVSGEQIVGKIIFRVWPLTRLGSVG